MEDKQNKIVPDSKQENNQTHEIRINTQSPPDKHTEKQISKQKMQEAMTKLYQTFTDAYQNNISYLPKTLSKLGRAIKDTITPMLELDDETMKNDAWNNMRESFRGLAESTERLTAYYDELDIYLSEEIKKPEYKGKDMSELIDNGLYEGKDPEPGNLWVKAITAAHEKMSKKQLPSVSIKRAEKIELPLDKLNAVSCGIWNLMESDTGGQLAFAMERRHSKKEITLYYSIDFDALGTEITITKRLTPFDKRVYIAISALFNNGNNIITLTQIYYAMGNPESSNPSQNQLEKINNAVTKMTGARITIDNTQEAEAYKYNKFVYDGTLLPLERGTAIINGQLSDAALHIFREPPIITFAKKRQQITTLDVKLLQSPVNKTDTNLLIDDYLLERISHMKNGKQCSRILLKTLYKKTEIKTKNQKSRAPEKIRRYLDHYKQCGFFKSYTMDPDGITIRFE